MELIMKKIIQLFLAVFILSASNITLADENDSCANLPGTWVGKAHLDYFLLDCEYDSVATVGEGNPSKAEVRIYRTSSNKLCPKQGVQSVDVSCHHGKVEMKDSKIDVAGYLSNDGRKADLEGNLYAMFRYHPFKLSVVKPN